MKLSSACRLFWFCNNNIIPTKSLVVIRYRIQDLEYQRCDGKKFTEWQKAQSKGQRFVRRVADGSSEEDKSKAW